MGVLVDAESTDTLREGILSVVSNDFTHINRNARKYAETFLSVDKIMVSYERIIQNGQASERASKFVAGSMSGATIQKAIMNRDVSVQKSRP